MLYQRPKGTGTWYASIYLRGPDGKLIRKKMPNGKLGSPRRKTISCGTTDKLAAEGIELALRQTRAKAQTGKKLENIAADLIEAVGKVCPEKRGNPLADLLTRVHPKTQRNTERTKASTQWGVKRFLRWIAASHPEVADIQQVGVPLCHEYFSDEFSSASGATLNRNRSALSTTWKRYMAATGIAIINPWLIVEHVPEDPRSYRDFTRQEVTDILRVCGKDTFWSFAVSIAFFSGLRLADVCNLHRGAFLPRLDAEGNPTGVPGTISVTPRKTRKSGRQARPPVQDALLPVLAEIERQMPADGEYLFPEAKRKHNVNPARLSREFSEILSKAGVKDNASGRVSFHSLRASYVTEQHRAGVPRAVISDWVGHGCPQVTKIYDKSEYYSPTLHTSMPKLLES